jgi:ribonuclease HI
MAMRVQLIQVPGHEGTDSNDTADKLAKLGSEMSAHRT